MRSTQASVFLVTILAVAPTIPAWADTTSEPTTTWQCSQPDGTALYTNKEQAGCQAMALKPISIVPNLEHMPTIPRPMVLPELQTIAPRQESASGMMNRSVPDWTRDWHANNMGAGSVQAEVCSLYMEWMQLVQKTRGGFYFGSDSSYGGDITGRSQRGASHSFYDNARYIALSRLFGTGFVPVGCF